MPILILDLDLTVWSTLEDLSHLHLSHHLSVSQKVNLGEEEHNVFLINPAELKALIESACNDHDGIILFTSGTWHESVRTVIADALELSENASKKVKECRFLSPLTCQENFPDNSLDEIRHLPKNTRFERYLLDNSELSDSFFVFLDNNLDHIMSFATSDKVRPILANTKELGIEFYEEANRLLMIAKTYEVFALKSWLKTNQKTSKKLDTNIHPDDFTSSRCLGPYNDDVILAALEQILLKRKEEETAFSPSVIAQSNGGVISPERETTSEEKQGMVLEEGEVIDQENISPPMIASQCRYSFLSSSRLATIPEEGVDSDNEEDSQATIGPG